MTLSERCFDVLVLGAGPAGTATAITCARAGLRIVMLERRRFPRSAPGETLHPGALPLLRRLGVEEAVLAAGFLRHPGHFVRWEGPEHFVPFGQDESGPWLGVQAWRPDFDGLLLECARQLGVTALQPCQLEQPIVVGGRVVGIETSCGTLRTPYVVDATGRSRWLVRQLRLATNSFGPRLTAWYGYLQGTCPVRDNAPALVADAGGWTWTARVRPGLYQWTRLSFTGAAPAKDWLPLELYGLRPRGSTCGADVSWRIADVPAGPGYFLVGDAAAALDPASSHGVLKALMSGMMAGHVLTQILRHGSPEQPAQRAYCAWLHRWFAHDVTHLKTLYSKLPNPPAWACRQH